MSEQGAPGQALAHGLVIDVEADERASYALSINRRPPVHSVRIVNNHGDLGKTIRVRLYSEWTADDRPPIREFIRELPAPVFGQDVCIPFTESRLDDSALAYLENATPAEIVVEVQDADGQILGTHRQDIVIQARNFWRHDLFGLTAAFVQAHHPAVTEIRQRVSEILASLTGDGSLEGYQRRSPQRVAQMGAAVFQALGERVTTYLMSPPETDFQQHGQRVRPLDELLETGQGNCIELACAYASCMFSIGIDPVIFLVHGHAFGGFYLEKRDIPDEGNRWNKALTTEFSSIQALMESGKVLALETTSIPDSVTFTEAIGAVSNHFVEQKPGCAACSHREVYGPHMEAVVDIELCFRDGVRSLPARVVRGDVEVVYVDTGRGEPPAIERRDPRSKKLLPDNVPARMQQWQTALLDLSRRNPLINFDALGRGIQILAPQESLGEIEDYLVDGGAIRLHGNDDINEVLKAAGVHSVTKIEDEVLTHNWSTGRTLFGGVHQVKRIEDPSGAIDESGKVKKIEETFEVDLRDRARDLNRNGRQSEDETGVNNLHIALGFVTWPYEPSSSSANRAIVDVTSPVFIVPVRMNVPRGGNVVQIALAEDSMTTVNYSLIEALRRKLGVKLEWFDEDLTDDSGLDIERGTNELRRELLATGWTDKGVRVEASMALGLFPFQRVRLWKDLNDHWKDFLNNPVIHHMVENGFGSFRDPADPEGLGTPDYNDLSLMSPQPADGAQTRAIVRALAGQSFVLEGPPGTGKSQTITNLLANALAAGKKVLFVAEKPDARSVVRERLQDVGLDPFCLDLHDQGSRPQEVKDQLRGALDFVPEDVEEQWTKFEDRYRAVTTRLQAYRDRIHGPTKSGKSYFDSYAELLALGSEPSADIGRALASVSAETLEEVRSLLLDLSGYSAPAQVRPGHPWNFVPQRNFSDIDTETLASQIHLIDDSIPAVSRMTGLWLNAVEQSSSLATLAAILSAARQQQSYGLPAGRDMVAILRGDWQSATDRALEGLRGALTQAREMSAEADAPLIARDLSAQLPVVTQAATGFFMGKKGKVKAALGELASHPVFTNRSPGEISTLITGLARTSEQYRESCERLRRTEGMDVRLLGDPIDVEALAVLTQRRDDLLHVARALSGGDAFAETLRTCIEDSTALTPTEILEAFVQPVSTLLAGSDSGDVEEWLNGRSVVGAVRECLPTWREGADEHRFLSLKRWLDLLEHLAPLEDPPFTQFRRQICKGDINAEDCVLALERSQLKAVLAVVAEEFNFDVFDEAEHDRYASLFVRLTEERQELLRKVIPAQLHAQRQFDSNSRAGAVAALRSELSSKRRGARSVRSLIMRYPDLIRELTPCFLMGPDSVAKFIPVGSLAFDIIVFDEASQILVEEAVGAMGRAQSVVIVGDSKQMPPSAGFRTRLTTEEDDLAVIDVDTTVEDGESILEEAVESGLNRELLAWHYRSRDEVLISFSNAHYYDGRLGSFPSPHRSRPGIGIEYRFVENGQFRHSSKAAATSQTVEGQLDQKFGGPVGTNPVEADAIVEEVVRRVHSPVDSQFSIGIVTLNKKQADLVEKKLTALQDQKITDLLTTEDNSRRLLVLNLENVQGRERDVIILGTSFSKKNPTDAKMPLNFGPLNQAGGERRLNVAITRARREVIVFSSFDPELLAPANAQGLKDLYEYLVLAREASTDRDALDLKSAPTPDAYRDEVAEALSNAGLNIRTGYGLSHFKVDIAVGSPDKPGEWVVGVLLDGRDWAERTLVLDRDGLPVTVLTHMMEWPAIARVWLPAWQRDHDEVVRGIKELVDLVLLGRLTPTPPFDDTVDINSTLHTSHGSEPLRDPAVAAEPETPMTAAAPLPGPPHPGFAVSPQLETPTSAAGHIGPRNPVGSEQSDLIIRPRPYLAPIVDGVLGSAEDLEYSGGLVKEVLTTLANNVGPFTVTDGLKAVANAFGLDRLRASRLDQLRGFTPRDLEVRNAFGEWLFPESCVNSGEVLTSEFTWYRESRFPERKIDQISPQELANAAIPIVRGAFEVELDELVTVLLDVFGYTRKTAETRSQVRAKIEWAAARQYFTLEGETLRILD